MQELSINCHTDSARQEHRQLVNSAFSLYGEAVVLLYGVDFSVTGGHYLPKMCKRYSEFFKHAIIKLLKVLVKCDATQPVGNMQGLSQTHPQEGQIPQERVRRTGVRPCPDSGTEEAQSEEGEQVEEPVKAAATHESEEEEDVGEVKDGALRAISPFLT